MDAESPGTVNMDQFKAAPNQLVVGQQMTMIAAEVRQTLDNERKKLEQAREDQERLQWEQSANQIVLKDRTRRENFRWKNATCKELKLYQVMAPTRKPYMDGSRKCMAHKMIPILHF